MAAAYRMLMARGIPFDQIEKGDILFMLRVAMEDANKADRPQQERTYYIDEIL